MALLTHPRDFEFLSRDLIAEAFRSYFVAPTDGALDNSPRPPENFFGEVIEELLVLIRFLDLHQISLSVKDSMIWKMAHTTITNPMATIVISGVKAN